MGLANMDWGEPSLMVASRGCAGGLVAERGGVDGSVEVYSHNSLNGVRKGSDWFNFD